MIEFVERIDRIHYVGREHRAPQREGIDMVGPGVRAESSGSAGARRLSVLDDSDLGRPRSSTASVGRVNTWSGVRWSRAS